MERLERADERRMMGPRRPDPRCSRSVTLEIEMPCAPRECEALLAALRPDDATAPPWMRIREERRHGSVVIVIEAPVSRVMSARQTADEVIEYSYSLLRSLEAISGEAGGSDEERSPSRVGEE